ncbi:MAG: hypothetical protein DME66_06545 [Verrucomicrobia bacterium]|nr:MAG: hypothetical protein DME66_06545 [Verrucomicrobiota bacterium]
MKVATIDPAEVRLLKCKACNARPRTGSAAHRKASASSKLPVVKGKAVGADAEAVAVAMAEAVAGVVVKAL